MAYARVALYFAESLTPAGSSVTIAGMTTTLQQDLQYAIELAKGAGRLILEQYGKVERLTKTHAATTDEAVTEADRAAQRFIVSGLRRRFPNDGIVGEESDTGTSITFDVPDTGARVWVIDPIDGTNNFIAGMGNFAVAIGLLDAGYPILGVVYDITRDQVYAAAKGQGAWVNTRRLQVQETGISNSAVIMLTSNLLTKTGRAPEWARRLLDQTDWKVRIIGSAALEAVHVASGVAHAAITLNGKLWDIAAPAAIVLEAGGVITDLSGHPIFPYPLRDYVGAKVPFVACNPQSQATLLREIANHP